MLTLLCTALLVAQPLPNTQPLEQPGDLALQMVEGMHRYLDRETATSAGQRTQRWAALKAPAGDAKMPEQRARFRKMLGMVDQRVPLTDLELIAGPRTSPVILETADLLVRAVRWPVFPGVDGEGLLVEPKGKVLAQVVLVPDAGQQPEQLIGMRMGTDSDHFVALQLARGGCRVVVPVLIDRDSRYSGNERLKRQTNIPHREFIYRMAYEMGRTLLGYEVQKVLAVVDWFSQTGAKLPIGVMGIGQGGQIALYAGALDPRITVTNVCLYFNQREGVADEPIDRNLWGQLREFGDAEIARMILPRTLLIEPHVLIEGSKVPASYWRTWDGPSPTQQIGQAAIGRIVPIPREGPHREWQRLSEYAEHVPVHKPAPVDPLESDWNWRDFLHALLGGEAIPLRGKQPEVVPAPSAVQPRARQKRQFDQLVQFTQKIWRDSETVREKRFAAADASSPEAWDRSTNALRNFFWEEVIGKLPAPDQPMNPRSRLIYDEPKWRGYEVTLDLYPDVFAYGILLLPKDLKPEEKRPVVVCQHGLEGRPTDICNPRERTKYYNSFGAQLADRGYIVFAPQNPYIGKDRFRQLQRKANPLKLSLFSFIVRQHERILDWLASHPNVDGDRIAFYGLSYGGKTAMRVPAILKKYALSICSGDFNEWIGKNVSVELPMTYMYTIEYEMPEFDLGTTFNYAEMAYLIAPRPFMVERGHDDGVGIDEWIASEFAKVRYLYAKRLKIPTRAELEFFVGGHEIHGKGTFEFLDRHLRR